MRSRLAVIRNTLFILSFMQAAQAADVVLAPQDLIGSGPGLYVALGPRLPAPDTTLPLIDQTQSPEAGTLLRSLNARGAINGFDGLVYDNRDRGHSTLPRGLFPRLAHLQYDPALKARGFDYGLAGAVVLPAVVFGNSSTAITGGGAPRSQTRMAMTRAGGPEAAARLYRQNHIYVYPEHRDHDAEDRFPANWPYTITSQGSSGSDRPFLRALAMTLAAFRPETMEAMRTNGLVAPTVQMILRRNLSIVTRREVYLTGAAHPAVFAGAELRPGRMVAHANTILPGDLPALIRLDVQQEDFAEAAGLAGLSERLFDTPSALARLWRGPEWEKTMTVSAAHSFNPTERPLRFEWRLLHGNPSLVEITPQGPDGATAQLRIRWHDAYTEPARGGEEFARRQVSRVDIGVFAHNGVHDSAPGFISIAFPTHQRRLYAQTGDGNRRLSLIDYDAVGRGVYYDPVLFWSAPWTDRPTHDAEGRLTGWTRRWTDGRSAEIAAEATRPYRIDRTDPRHPTLIPAAE